MWNSRKGVLQTTLVRRVPTQWMCTIADLIPAPTRWWGCSKDYCYLLSSLPCLTSHSPLPIPKFWSFWQCGRIQGSSAFPCEQLALVSQPERLRAIKQFLFETRCLLVFKRRNSLCKILPSMCKTPADSSKPPNNVSFSSITLCALNSSVQGLSGSVGMRDWWVVGA